MHPRLLRSETDSLIICESLYLEVLVQKESESHACREISATMSQMPAASGKSTCLKLEATGEMEIVITSCKK